MQVIISVFLKIIEDEKGRFLIKFTCEKIRIAWEKFQFKETRFLKWKNGKVSDYLSHFSVTAFFQLICEKAATIQARIVDGKQRRNIVFYNLSVFENVFIISGRQDKKVHFSHQLGLIFDVIVRINESVDPPKGLTQKCQGYRSQQRGAVKVRLQGLSLARFSFI